MDIDLDACIDGCPRAWSAFVDRYARVIAAAVRRVVGHGPIDDPVQEVFVRLVRDDYRLLRRFDPERASLPTWLTLVARSTAIDWVRKRRVPTVPIADHDGTAVAAPQSAEEPAMPEIPLHLLTGRQRLVLRMLFEQDLSVPEAAAMLQVDEQTVRSTKHKALIRLREHFRSRLPGMFTDDDS